MLGVICIGLYVLKSVAGFNLFESVSISGYFPFDHLQLVKVSYPEAGDTIIDENFEKRFRLIRRWSRDVNAKHPGATLDFEQRYPEASRYAVIRIPDGGWWSIGSRYLVAVNAGDCLEAEALVRNGSSRGRAEIQIATYDQSRKLIDFSRWRAAPDQRFEFERVTLRVSVPSGVGYVRLRLAGSGAGEFGFDDVKFWRDGSR